MSRTPGGHLWRGLRNRDRRSRPRSGSGSLAAATTAVWAVACQRAARRSFVRVVARASLLLGRQFGRALRRLARLTSAAPFAVNADGARPRESGMTAGVKRALRMGSAVSADGTESKQPLGARAAGSLTSLLLLDPCNGLGAPSTPRLAAPSRSKRESPISGQMRHTPRPHRRGASRAYAGGSCFAWLKRTSRGRRLALAARPRRQSLAALATSQRGIDLRECSSAWKAAIGKPAVHRR